MKKKGRVKKVEKSRVECESKVEPQPEACLFTPRLSMLKEQTGNLYENKARN